MYHNEMEKIIEKVVKGDIDKNVLMEYLIDDFDNRCFFYIKTLCQWRRRG